MSMFEFDKSVNKKRDSDLFISILNEMIIPALAIYEQYNIVEDTPVSQYDINRKFDCLILISAHCIERFNDFGIVDDFGLEDKALNNLLLRYKELGIYKPNIYLEDIGLKIIKQKWEGFLAELDKAMVLSPKGLATMLVTSSNSIKPLPFEAVNDNVFEKDIQKAVLEVEGLRQKVVEDFFKDGLLDENDSRNKNDDEIFPEKVDNKSFIQEKVSETLNSNKYYPSLIKKEAMEIEKRKAVGLINLDKLIFKGPTKEEIEEEAQKRIDEMDERLINDSKKYFRYP